MSDIRKAPRERSRPHPDIQIYESIIRDGDNEIVTYLGEENPSFSISGRVQPEDRAVTSRATRPRDEETTEFINRIRNQNAATGRTRARRAAARQQMPSEWLVAFIEGHRIAEYDRAHRRRRTLTFPPSASPNRNYYQGGDFILVAENSRRLMERIFPELRPESDGLTFLGMLSDYLGISDREVKIGYKIMGVRTDSAVTGEGQVRIRPHLFIDNTTAIVFTGRPDIRLSRQELHRRFDENLRWGALSSAATVGGAVIEIVTLPITGGVRAIGARLVRRVGRRYLVRSSRRFRRAVLRIILSKIRKIITDFIIALATNVARKVMQHRQQNRTRRQFQIKEVVINWDRVLTEAVTSATISALVSALGSIADRRLKNFLNGRSNSIRQAYPNLNINTPYELIEHFILSKMKDIALSSTQNIVESLSQSLINISYDDQNQNTLAREFREKLTQDIQAGLSNLAQRGFTGVLNEIFSGRTVE